jgi:hypothetical protein
MRDLAAFGSKRWLEHFVVGEPFGVLGMDTAGTVTWLQLEPSTGLHALAEVAEIEGVPPARLDDIRQGRVLADIELRQALGLHRPSELVPAIRIGDEGQLLGALFTIDAAHAPDIANSYTRWLARQDKRRVQD